MSPKIAQKAGISSFLAYLSCLLLFLILSTSCSDASSAKVVQVKKIVQPPHTQPIVCAAHSTQPITLNMYYGSEKQAWITEVVADFNSRHSVACDGPITVNAVPIGSGLSMQEIVSGKIQPDIWSPAGSAWLNLLNEQWQEKYGSDLLTLGANDSPSLVSSPVVIAMWKPEAEALGWPNREIGWSDIAALSTDPKGWATYGHPEFGDFKFGHTRPDDSNSGLDAIIAEHYAALHKVRELTSEDVKSGTTQSFVSNVESAVIHYGDSTGFFANEMFSKGPDYLSAAVMYESLVVEANNGKKYPHLPFPVVALYPKEGTFYSDHPFVIPQGAWMTPAKKEAALAFRNFLLATAQQQKALKYGFRPTDLSTTRIASPIDTAHGVDPAQPTTLLQVPNAQIIKEIETSWSNLRRKVDVMLVLDRSGSMNEAVGGVSKIEAAKQGVASFVNLLQDSDKVGFTVFSSITDVLKPMALVGPERKDVLDTINGVVADGTTCLFDTVIGQVQMLRAYPTKHIKVLIVLTDGLDTSSTASKAKLTSVLTGGGTSAANQVKVYTIAYGGDADVNSLKQIADTTSGQEYAGTPQNIKQIYLQISQFF